MTQTWYLFRHALATLNLDGYGDEILTASILPDYKKPIEKIGLHLKKTVNNAHFYTSPVIRCLQTSDIIKKYTGFDYVVDDKLTEYHNETFPNLSDRINNFLTKSNKSNCTNIIVCTHGTVIAGLKNLITDNKFNKNQILDYPACGELLIIKERKIQLVNFNQTY